MAEKHSLHECKCNRCGYRWLPRTFTPPRQCPGCKTTYWAKDRVRNIAKARRAKSRVR